MDGQAPRLSSFFLLPPGLVLVGILIFVALLYRQQPLIVLSLLVLGTAGCAKLWASWSNGRIATRSTIDRRRLFPGERLTLTLEAANRGFLPAALQVAAPTGGLLGPTGESVVGGEAGLLWYQAVAFAWTLTAARRGVFRLGSHRCTAGDLLGLFDTTRAAGESREIVVYPRVVPLGRFPIPRRDFFGVPGADSPIRDPVYILGTREYQPGRPAKHIHWKATARHQRLQEKLFEPTEQEKVLLAVDVEGFARHGADREFERTIESVASVAVRLDREGCAVGLTVNGVVEGGKAPTVPIGRHPQQVQAILELLARLGMKATAPLAETLRVGHRLPWGVSCLCFARENDDCAASVVNDLGRRRVPTVLVVARHGGGQARAHVLLVDELLPEEPET